VKTTRRYPSPAIFKRATSPAAIDPGLYRCMGLWLVGSIIYLSIAVDLSDIAAHRKTHLAGS
jgi:hypothetical protein